MSSEVIIFKATWCRPCINLTHELFESEFNTKVYVVNDSEEDQALVNQYRIQRFPTVIVMHDNNEKTRICSSNTRLVYQFVKRHYLTLN